MVSAGQVSAGEAPAGLASELSRRAVGLVDRLVAREERLHGLERDNARLRRELRTVNTQAGGLAFDVPRTVHDWPLADDPDRDPAGLWQYDVRVDDAVVLEGRRGEVFLTAHGLAGRAPDFLSAIAALNELAAARAAEGTPDVSIVIPVHGELAWTLNALDSLLRHASRFSFEIIVMDDVSPDLSGELLPYVAGIRYVRRAQNGGFIASCNEGAELAAGRYVVMLNNDTRVVEGWLDELIESFARWPAAGLVGSKLHYADGSLQEAGGIVWRDGSASNYGRGDDPNRPQYSYARQVDYISGCAIALPMELWRALGGFDAYFAPAYCEDVDLAMRVRAAGREVWLQPQSRIVHYEGKTSGTDTGTGVKAYQVTNTKKLLRRWRPALTRHRNRDEAPYFERERGQHQRLLVVDVTAPTPDQDAGSVQTYLALRCALALGYKTHFVPQDNWLFQPRYTTDLQRMGVDCAYAPYELGFEAYMRRYGALFDAVLVYRPTGLEAALPAIRAHAPQAACLFHVADLHYLRMQRTAELEDSDDLRFEAAAMRERELLLVAQADCTITHSSIEREILSEAAPGCPVALWPLMSEIAGTARGFAGRRDICFLGGYRHPPNEDAVIYFVERIFPLLRAAEPGIRFIIAGSFATEAVRALACDDVIVRGQVGDLRELFDECRVFVCPLRVGAGVKGKVASALAYGIPVVSTPIGVEGSGLVEGRDVLVADTPADFADSVLRLYRDATLWEDVSRNGLVFVEENLSLGMGVRALEAALDMAYATRLGLNV
jgi:GT2 family glycosyltransferase